MRRRAAGLGEASEVQGGVTGCAGSGERKGMGEGQRDSEGGRPEISVCNFYSPARSQARRRWSSCGSCKRVERWVAERSFFLNAAHSAIFIAHVVSTVSIW
jgi:hypothetical protein